MVVNRPSEDFEADDRSKRGDHLMTARLLRVVEGLQLIDPDGGIFFDVLPVKTSAKKRLGQNTRSRETSARLLLLKDVSAFDFPDDFNAASPVFSLAMVFENDKGEVADSGFIVKSQSQQFLPDALLDFINNKMDRFKERNFLALSALCSVLAFHSDAKVRDAIQVKAKQMHLYAQKETLVSLAL